MNWLFLETVKLLVILLNLKEHRTDPFTVGKQSNREWTRKTPTGEQTDIQKHLIEKDEGAPQRKAEGMFIGTERTKG